jgi:hypothetical protein
MKALSVRSPWWWFILHGGKDIENRDWHTNFRGTVYLHAGKWFQLDEVAGDSRTAVSIAKEHGRHDVGGGFTYRELRDVGGCIVGKIDIVGCVSESASPWFFGKYGFVLANPVAFEAPIPFKGALGFFDVPDGVVRS